MKTQKRLHTMLLAICLLSMGTLLFSSPVHAKKLTNMRQAIQAAQKAVKNADVSKTSLDYENGQLLYEICLIKKTREYDITYRASDGKMLAYDWEEHAFKRSSNKKLLSKKKCQDLALKEVPGAKVMSLVQKYDDGVLVYKIRLTQDKTKKKYTLKYHAKTGKLLEYGWELGSSAKDPATNGLYIKVAKAKKNALSKVPGATIIKAEFDMDDGVPVYEIELVKGNMEYEIKIHATSGKILKIEQDYNDNWR